ncbi:MAG: hypothetical protein CMJ33_11210 [Phycisphaerae bacterium]|nr:hypothetical protein [Phycisphaerae bacterium]
MSLPAGFIPPGRIDVQMSTGQGEARHIGRAGRATGISFRHPHSDRIEVERFHGVRSGKSHRIAPDARAGVDDVSGPVSLKSSRLPFGDALSGRLLDPGQIAPKSPRRDELPGRTATRRDQLQSHADLFLIPMATQASDIGDLRLIDLLREPEQPVTVIGQQPMPRGKAARSMIGIGIHVMPSYLPQPQTATAYGVFPMTTNANVRQALASKWWIFMLDGCLLILMGLMLVLTQLNGAVAFISVVGYLLVFGAIIGVFAAGQQASAGANSAMRWFLPVIAGGIGLVLIIDPGQSIEVIVTLLGFATLLIGAMQFAAGLGLARHGARGILITVGLLGILAGIVMLLFPLAAAWVLTIFFGVQFILAGWIQLGQANQLRRIAG